MFESQQFQMQSIWLSGSVGQERFRRTGASGAVQALAFRDWIHSLRGGLTSGLASLRGRAETPCPEGPLQTCC